MYSLEVRAPGPAMLVYLLNSFKHNQRKPIRHQGGDIGYKQRYYGNFPDQDKRCGKQDESQRQFSDFGHDMDPKQLLRSQPPGGYQPPSVKSAWQDGDPAADRRRLRGREARKQQKP